MAIEEATILFRIQASRRYLTFLSQSLHQDWNVLHQQYITGLLQFPEAMTLVHPVFYPLNIARLLGPRAFPVDVGTAVCACSEVWGYECVFSGEDMCADHTFPYSLGGPTLATNKTYLCSLHNRMKANDVHLFRWEMGEPVWLKPLIGQIKFYQA